MKHPSKHAGPVIHPRGPPAPAIAPASCPEQTCNAAWSWPCAISPMSRIASRRGPGDGARVLEMGVEHAGGSFFRQSSPRVCAQRARRQASLQARGVWSLGFELSRLTDPIRACYPLRARHRRIRPADRRNAVARDLICQGGDVDAITRRCNRRPPEQARECFEMSGLKFFSL